MSEIQVLLPKMGESVAEATITTWLKAVGDAIEEDEPIVEIATDKVDSEVPSPASGILKEILFQEGDVVEVGASFAVIQTEGDVENNSTPIVSTESNSSSVEIEQEIETTILEPLSENGKNEDLTSNSDGKFYSPLVRSIAKEEGVSVNDLNTIIGSGSNGRVTKKDILSFISSKGSATTSSSAKTATTTALKAVPVQSKTSASIDSGQNEVIEMDRMRKLIADHMVMSVQTAPHVTSFVEADVTNIVLWRNKIKNKFQEKEGEKFTFTPIFLEAVAKALRDFPMVNSSIDGDKIIVKKDINVGMATALPSGNLIVPVIKNTDQLNIVGLAKKVNDLANRARVNKLSPDEIQGGTYTISNVGTFGNVMGTPIINQPQSAILALGAIRKKPAVIETPTGDVIAIRHMMFLSHSYDHRNVDGALGGQFVKRVADYLENFDLNREI
jgi:2-oxoglutarate dehydrogenase E2 component (dihydrolipoamide succinyltransferase)